MLADCRPHVNMFLSKHTRSGSVSNWIYLGLLPCGLQPLRVKFCWTIIAGLMSLWLKRLASQSRDNNICRVHVALMCSPFFVVPVSIAIERLKWARSQGRWSANGDKMNAEVDQSGVGAFLSPLGSHLIDSCKSQPWQINKQKEYIKLQIILPLTSIWISH